MTERRVRCVQGSRREERGVHGSRSGWIGRTGSTRSGWPEHRFCVFEGGAEFAAVAVVQVGGAGNGSRKPGGVRDCCGAFGVVFRCGGGERSEGGRVGSNQSSVGCDWVRDSGCVCGAEG